MPSRKPAALMSVGLGASRLMAKKNRKVCSRTPAAATLNQGGALASRSLLAGDDRLQAADNRPSPASGLPHPLQADLLDDFQSVAVEADDLARVVGEQTNARQAERDEDLRADAVVAEGHAGFAVFAEGFDDLGSALGVLHVEHDAASGGGDGLHGGGQLQVTGGAALPENVVQKVFAVHAHERGLGPEFAEGEREVMTMIHLAAENVQLEFAELAGEGPGTHALDELLAAVAVFDQRGDRDHAEAELLLEFQQLRQAGHGAVVVEDFADDGARVLG